MGRIGIQVKKGSIVFEPILLRRQEFLSEADEFLYYDVKGDKNVIPLDKDNLAFTYCQIPVKYLLSEAPKIVLHYKDGSIKRIVGNTIDEVQSTPIFKREGTITLIEVWLDPEL